MDISRRELLKVAGVAAATGLVGTPAAAQAVGIRRDIGTLGLNDPAIETYRKAVAAMRALPNDHPHSWVRQANIHQRSCPHGNWFFLPWHRAYLGAFETICRKVTGDNSFCLPYWNWTKDAQVPKAFWETVWNGQPNPLLNGTRVVQESDSAPLESIGSEIVDQALAETSFELFGSFKPTGQDSLDQRFQRARGAKALLERTPHDDVHVWIQGDMMSMLSPLDPIFWLHHCNIDRIWAHWQAAQNSNPTDPHWQQFVFKGDFFDGNGNPFDVRVDSLGDTMSLGYRYDTVPVAQVGDMQPAIAEGILERPRGRLQSMTLRAATLNQEAAWPINLSGVVESATRETVRSTAPEKERIVAVVKDVQPPKNLNIRVRVFLNCPYLDEKVPPNDPHYVGSFSFFGSEHEHHGQHQGTSYVFDLSRTLERLGRSKSEPTDQLEVQLLPVAFAGRDVPQSETLTTVTTAGIEILAIRG